VNKRSINLIIADDHPVVLHGLVSLLSGESDFKVLAACEDGAAALEAIFKHSPNIALLDLRLPKLSGLAILEKVANEALWTRIVILTAFTGDSDVLAAVSRGVHGIIMKDAAADTLVQCLRGVSAGGRWIAPELIKREIQLQAEAASVDQLLTLREREVMGLVAEGRANKFVAEQLRISEGTLKLHLHHIYAKTGAKCKSELVELALRVGQVLEHPFTRKKSVAHSKGNWC
jgi:two-component system nitrate/nitrite response regulator NarL